MKLSLYSVVRTMGLLGLADHVRFAIALAGSYRRNRAFERSHPHFPVPPWDIAYDALNHVDWDVYQTTGQKHAEIISGLIRENMSTDSIDILEWGCGPGRIIRHLGERLEGVKFTLTGSDVNLRTVEWCRNTLPGIEFFPNALQPPLAQPDARFDIIYCFSVFTHLSEQAQKDWMDEFRRLLKPNGIFICTTHGNYFQAMLDSKDQVGRFRDGHVVVQAGAQEGKKWYIAIHPQPYVRDELLHGFDDVRTIPLVPEEAWMLQDLWIARKSTRPAAASAALV